MYCFSDYIELTRSYMLPCMTEELVPTRPNLEEMKITVMVDFIDICGILFIFWNSYFCLEYVLSFDILYQ